MGCVTPRGGEGGSSGVIATNTMSPWSWIWKVGTWYCAVVWCNMMMILDYKDCAVKNVTSVKVWIFELSLNNSQCYLLHKSWMISGQSTMPLHYTSCVCYVQTFHTHNTRIFLTCIKQLKDQLSNNNKIPGFSDPPASTFLLLVVQFLFQSQRSMTHMHQIAYHMSLIVLGFYNYWELCSLLHVLFQLQISLSSACHIVSYENTSFSESCELL